MEDYGVDDMTADEVRSQKEEGLNGCQGGGLSGGGCNRRADTPTHPLCEQCCLQLLNTGGAVPSSTGVREQVKEQAVLEKEELMEACMVMTEKEWGQWARRVAIHSLGLGDNKVLTKKQERATVRRAWEVKWDMQQDILDLLTKGQANLDGVEWLTDKEHMHLMVGAGCGVQWHVKENMRWGKGSEGSWHVGRKEGKSMRMMMGNVRGLSLIHISEPTRPY